MTTMTYPITGFLPARIPEAENEATYPLPPVAGS